MNTATLLIQSKQPDNFKMGTGFVIHQDSFGFYVLTCAHVVEQVVEPKIDGRDVEVKNIGSSESLDLALLYVKGIFKTPFELQKRKCQTKDVQLIGFSFFSSDKYQGKIRNATILGDKVTLKGIEENVEYKAWQIVSKDKYEIEPGNSGGPLICQESGKVIGVMSNSKGGKYGGYAIAIEHLADIWDDMPPLLLDGNESPFVGLSAFSIEQSHLFFGRDKEIAEIIEKLKIEDIIAVVGDSGSGKSSVIKAGVIPKYLNGALADVSEDKRTFHFIDTRPTENPFDELANSIDHISKVLNLDLRDIDYLKEQLKSQDSKKVLNILQSVFQQDNVTLLIYIDQFEELFTLCEEKKIRQAFLDMIKYLIEHQTSKLIIKVIFTMRRDYYNLVSEYIEFYNLIDKEKYTLNRMNDKSLKECIVKPLENTSISLKEINAFADFVVQDMGDKSSELALLQIALTQTWNHKKAGMTLIESYRKVRGVSGALEKLATDTIEVLEEEEKKRLKYIFIRLIKVRDKGAITRRIVDRDEFSDKDWKLVQVLASALDSKGETASQNSAKLGRLLNIHGEDNSKNETVELSHEALITQWSAYQGWIHDISTHLKKIHDTVIDKSKIYRKKQDSKYLLMGADLEEGLKLLDDEYIAYLSRNEVAYIENSQSQKKISQWVKIGVLVLLLAVIAYLYSREKSMTINDLKERIYTSEKGRYSRDTNYMDLILVNTKKLKKVDKEIIVKKLIELTPNIANGSEKKYWLNRVDVMNPSKLDELLSVLEFEAYINKGNANFNQAKHPKAIVAYSKAIKLNAQEEYPYLYIGNAYFYMQKYKEAIDFYKKILEINPNSEIAYFNIGNTYNFMKKSKKAIESFNRLLEINPNNEYAYNGIGIAYGDMKKHVDALNAFKKVVEINPGNFLAYYSIGLAYSYLGQYNEAMQSYEKALTINPTYLPIYNSIIVYYKYVNNPEKVIEYTKKLIHINSKVTLNYLNLFEYQLINNMQFDREIEKQYIKQFKNYSFTYVRYEMLKILRDIYEGKGVDLEQWNKKYFGVRLNWNFVAEEQWINNMSDGETKTKLVEALKVFKRHG